MRSILLVDDDEDDRSLFKEAVNSLDKSIQCWTAHDGQHALQVLMYDLIVIPDVIFLDLNMPKMNGLEFLSTIKKKQAI
jgi:CheY-like chemotaxis protein